MPPLGKFIQKMPMFAILGAVDPYFLSHNDEIWHEGADLELPPQAKFGKSRFFKRGYTPLGKGACRYCIAPQR